MNCLHMIFPVEITLTIFHEVHILISVADVMRMGYPLNLNPLKMGGLPQEPS